MRRYNIEFFVGPCDKDRASRDTELEKHNEIKIMRATAATVKADNDVRDSLFDRGYGRGCIQGGRYNNR